jgi:hypothetical protein
MTLVAVLVIVLVVALYGYLLKQGRRLWCGQPTRLDAVITSRTRDAAASRAYIRAFPAIAVLGAAFLSAAIVLSFFDAGTGLGRVAAAAMFVISLVAFLLIPSIVFLNRPKRCVPPRMRVERGLLEERSRSRNP